MPRQRELPPADELRRLLHTTNPATGLRWTQADIARKYGVSRQAVSMACQAARLVDPPTRYDELIPWRIKDRHQRHYALKMLRLLARRRRGDELEPSENRYLDRWLMTLAEIDGVVDYNEEDGFYYTHRRDGIDRDVIREPEWRLAGAS